MTPGAGRPALFLSLLGSAHGLHSSALSLSTRLFRNCGLVTMLSTRLPKRSPSAASRVRMPFDGLVVRGQQAAPQGIGQQLAAEVVDKLVAAGARRDKPAGRRLQSPRRRRETSRGYPRAGRRGRWCGTRRWARSLRRPVRSSRTARGNRRSSCRRGGGPAPGAGSASPSLASSLGSSGTLAGGAGMFSPSNRRTTQ